MTITYTAAAGDGLFDIQGVGFRALTALNTVRKTTVANAVMDYLRQYKLKSVPSIKFEQAMQGVPNSLSSWQRSGLETLRQTLENLVLEFVEQDKAQPVRQLKNALEYIIDQMKDTGNYVTPNVIAMTLAATSTNAGDVAVCYATRRPDGRVQENSIGEEISVKVSNADSAVTPTVRFRGQAAVTPKTSQDWPAGSGCDVQLSATDPANSLLTNGDFEDETISNIPNNWLVHVGTVGSTVLLSSPEVQTVAISNTPTSGSYVLQWSNGTVTRSTTELAYNAAASTVQAVLRLIPGLELVTVTATGTSPNFTHTITFIGAPGGNLSQLTSVNHLVGGTTGGVITHATTVGGDDGNYRGQSLIFDSNGTELSAVYHALDLDVRKVYFCPLRRLPLAGSVSVKLPPVDEPMTMSVSSGMSPEALLIVLAEV